MLREIRRGKYQDCYLKYQRKSSDEADSQVNSIEYQDEINGQFMAKENLPIADVTLEGFCENGIINERHSGFKEDGEISFSKDGKVQYHIDRPKFLQAAQFLSAGYFKGIVFLCWDRASRNDGDDTVLKKLKRNRVDIRFALATYDNSSAGDLHMDIDGMYARSHSRITSEKVKIAIHRNRKNGLWTHRAPVGYLNPGTMEHKPIDPERGPIIKELFELYATGTYSLSDLARIANDKGLTIPPLRTPRTKEQMLAQEEIRLPKKTKPIRTNYVSHILRNPFYTGRVLDPERNWIMSNCHDPLVDDETFARVQELLGKRTVSIHYEKLINHPLRGKVRCTSCNRVYTPYTKKGILYFYSRCVPGCTNPVKSYSLTQITDEIRKRIEGLQFSDEELSAIEAQIGTEIALLEKRRDGEIRSFEGRKKQLREELAFLRSNKLSLIKSGAYSAEEIVEQQKELERKYDDLLEKETISERAMRDMMKDVTTLSELLKGVVGYYDFADPYKKEEIIQIIFSELYLSENGLEYKVQKGFEPFADRISAMGSPMSWLSEHLHGREQMRLSIAALRSLIEA